MVCKEYYTTSCNYHIRYKNNYVIYHNQIICNTCSEIKHHNHICIRYFCFKTRSFGRPRPHMSSTIHHICIFLEFPVTISILCYVIPYTNLHTKNHPCMQTNTNLVCSRISEFGDKIFIFGLTPNLHLPQ